MTSPADLPVELRQQLNAIVQRGTQYNSWVEGMEMIALEAYRLAVVHERERMTWQPIASAPKDGTIVLLRNATHLDVGRWRQLTQEWDTRYRLNPTHWIPQEWLLSPAALRRGDE